VIDALNEEGEYDVLILDETRRKDYVSDIEGVMSDGPEVVVALLEAHLVTTSVGPSVLLQIAPTLYRGIGERRKAGKGPLNVIACENEVGATTMLKKKVEELAFKEPADLEYIQQTVGFANCSVDRIVPPFEGDTVLEVGVEDFYEWIVDEEALKGPPLGINGMKLSKNLDAYIERKLFTLNTGHAMLAFLGFLKGYKTIDEAVRDLQLRKIAQGGMEESGAALIKKHGFDPAEHERYVQKSLSRFENSNIHDDLVRVSRNPLRKLGENDRLVGPIMMAKEYSLPRANLLKGVAAGFLHHNKDDKESVELNRIIQELGIEDAIVQITPFEKGDDDYETVLKDYRELQEHNFGT